MQVTDELVRGVVQQVLSQMRNGKPATNGTSSKPRGVFSDAESAIKFIAQEPAE